VRARPHCAVRTAAWAAARAAARAAAARCLSAAAWAAARAAADGDGGRAAAWAKQEKRLISMLYHARKVS
jgi:hypothetical protein